MPFTISPKGNDLVALMILYFEDGGLNIFKNEEEEMKL